MNMNDGLLFRNLHLQRIHTTIQLQMSLKITINYTYKY